MEIARTAEISVLAASEPDYQWCAQLMAATDPWITLGRDQQSCAVALRRPGSELFLARRGDLPLGFILLRANGVAGSPYIAAIAVAAEARGRGVGTHLLIFAEQRFPDARNLFLCVSDFNDRARALYESHGYTQVGLLDDYVVEGHAEVLMRKRLK